MLKCIRNGRKSIRDGRKIRLNQVGSPLLKRVEILLSRRKGRGSPIKKRFQTPFYYFIAWYKKIESYLFHGLQLCIDCVLMFLLTHLAFLKCAGFSFFPILVLFNMIALVLSLRTVHFAIAWLFLFLLLSFFFAIPWL